MKPILKSIISLPILFIFFYESITAEDKIISQKIIVSSDDKTITFPEARPLTNVNNSEHCTVTQPMVTYDSLKLAQMGEDDDAKSWDSYKVLKMFHYTDRTFLLQIQSGTGLITVYDLKNYQTETALVIDPKKQTIISPMKWSVRGVYAVLGKEKNVIVFRDISMRDFPKKEVTEKGVKKMVDGFDFWYVMAGNSIYIFKVDGQGSQKGQSKYEIRIGSQDSTPTSITAYNGEVAFVKDNYINILTFINEKGENEKPSKFGLKQKNTYFMRGLNHIQVIRGGNKVFVRKQSKKMSAFMTLRGNSWNPFEDLKQEFISGKPSIDLSGAYFDNIIAAEKDSSGAFLYWYWVAETVNGETKYIFKKVMEKKIRKEFKKFVETDQYIVMYNKNEIRVFAKGSNYRTMDGFMYVTTKSQPLEILGILPAKVSSLIQGFSIKILLKYQVKGKPTKVYLHNLKLKNGYIKCFSMTSLLTFMDSSQQEVISVEAMAIKTPGRYNPGVKYKYYVKFIYTYGLQGLLFWGQCVFVCVLLSLTCFVRTSRMLSIKRIMRHPTSLLKQLKDRMLKDDDEEVEGLKDGLEDQIRRKVKKSSKRSKRLKKGRSTIIKKEKSQEDLQ